jgi:hypothetical protein
MTAAFDRAGRHDGTGDAAATSARRPRPLHSELSYRRTFLIEDYQGANSRRATGNVVRCLECDRNRPRSSVAELRPCDDRGDVVGRQESTQRRVAAKQQHFEVIELPRARRPPQCRVLRHLWRRDGRIQFSPDS